MLGARFHMSAGAERGRCNFFRFVSPFRISNEGDCLHKLQTDRIISGFIHLSMNAQTLEYLLQSLHPLLRPSLSGTSRPSLRWGTSGVLQLPWFARHAMRIHDDINSAWITLPQVFSWLNHHPILPNGHSSEELGMISHPILLIHAVSTIEMSDRNTQKSRRDDATTTAVLKCSICLLCVAEPAGLGDWELVNGLRGFAEENKSWCREIWAGIELNMNWNDRQKQCSNVFENWFLSWRNPTKTYTILSRLD